MEQTVGNVTVSAEFHDTEPETVQSFADVTAKYNHLQEEMKEHLYAVFLNASNDVLAEKLISLGNAGGTGVDVADIARTAVLTNSRAVILIHNHPSGDPSPTDDDITATRTVRDALDLLGIDLLDHVIIARNGTHSMRGHDDLQFNG